MATIKVRGRGTVAVRPDEAVVSFEVVAVADAAADAFSVASARANALDAVLDDAGIEAARRSTVGIVLHEHQELDPSGQPRRTHRASTTVSVRFSDADSIPPVLKDAVDRADAYVRGPQWRLADPTDAAAEACRRAAADAATRAEAYAGTLGRCLGAVETVEEGTTHDPSPVRSVVLRATTGGEPPPLYPGELEIAAAVDVVFALEPE
jgi:uncharacterized protein YggE